MTDRWQGDSPWWKPELCLRLTKKGLPCQNFRYNRYAYACKKHETPAMLRMTRLRYAAFKDGEKYAAAEADFEIRKLRLKIEALQSRLGEDVLDAEAGSVQA